MPLRKINKSRPWFVEKKKFSRDRDFSRFYNARKWRKVTKSFLLLNPFCVECEANGIVKAARVTDHVKGLGYLIDNNLDPYDTNELAALCQKCHNKKSGRESHNNRGMGLKTLK